jgi:uncharacterized protein YpbB/GTPase SAR1 family protein
MEMTDLIAVASRFVNSTNSHIFLTGKAGTGKTTFLHSLAESTHKRHVIVAPTGIAALNAKGVTIHSQFLLPLGTFIPEREAPQDLAHSANYYAQRTLAAKHPLNKIRRQVLRNIDLIIIDEVSMLRADVLDAIDYRMRSVRNNFQQSFGGVQVLMIGDLYQLPPVVKDNEKAIMGRYYRSPHFFEAKALQQSGFVFIELDKIFRQKNDRFIGLLNNLRNNTVTEDDIRELNSHYVPEPKDEKDEVITLTTHNYRAEELNQKALAKLPGRSHYFDAVIKGEFPESAYPVLQRIELKIGAQVMFVKNDTSGAGVYFNGKLATVTQIDEDGIAVRLAGTGMPFILRSEEWENKRYSTDERTKDLTEEVIGTFAQYPIRLAWAITVHKSQGLTFEKAIIDVGQAFAPGQVYVALSRLTSLDGLTLRTPIQAHVVTTDGEVVEFSKRKDVQPDMATLLRQRQEEFLRTLLLTTFNFEDVERELVQVQQKHQVIQEFEDAEMRSALPLLQQHISVERENTERFRQQLGHLLQTADHERLMERLSKATAYFEGRLKEWVKELLIHMAEVGQLAKVKTYAGVLEELDLLLMKKWDELLKSEHMARSILAGTEIAISPQLDRKRSDQRLKLLEEVRETVAANPKNSSRKTGRISKPKATEGTGKKKAVKGETYLETFALLKEGLSPVEVSAKRALSVTTIESHIAKGIGDGVLNIQDFLTEAQIEEIATVLRTGEHDGISPVHKALDGKYSFGQIRMVVAYKSKTTDS